MKERMLTVLVPIKDSDATVVTSLPAVTPDNINVIYKHEGVYKRIWLNPVTNQYEYHEVVDREFPYLGKPLEIFDFTYDATRMGSAPTITAQGVMWYADKDENNNDVTLEDLWLERNNDCHVTFNGENFYLKQVPTCGKSNEDARYRYDIEFVSERSVLEHVYLYDVVQPFITEKPITESSTFSFFGNIYEFIKRINASLIKSGLCQVTMRATPISYAEWNALGINSPDQPPYSTYSGNYTNYLHAEILVFDEHGEIATTGYRVVVDEDHEESENYTKEILLTFDNNTIHEALQKIRDEYGLLYFFKRNDNGDPIAHVGERDHDFGEDNPFQYGIDNELLQIEKTNKTKEIITAITGVGGTQNIPWYYPNPTPDGWIVAEYFRNGAVIPSVVSYPTSEASPLYEAYLKNRVGNDFTFGLNSPIQVIRSMETPLNANIYTYTYPDDEPAEIDILYDLGEISPDDYFVLDFSRRNSSAYLKDNAYKAEVELVDIGDLQRRINWRGVEIEYYNTTHALTEETWYFRNDYDDEGENYVSPPFNDVQRDWLCRSIREGFSFRPSEIPNKRYGVEIIIQVPEESVSRELFYQELYYYPEVKIELTSGGIFWYNNVPHVKKLTVRIPAFVCKKKLELRVDDPWNTDGVYYTYNGQKFESAEAFDEITFPSNAEFIAKNGKVNNSDYYKYTFDHSSSEYLSACPRWVWRLCERKVGTYETSVLGINFVSDGSTWSNATRQIRWYNFKGQQVSNNVDAYEFLRIMGPELFSITLSKQKKQWFLGNNAAQLSTRGLTLQSGFAPSFGDIIRFRSVKYLTPQSNLMPQLYIKTDGARRFYHAHNYDPTRGSYADLDTDSGEVWQEHAIRPDGTEIQEGIINPLYFNKDDNDNHYWFENIYQIQRFREHIEKMDDIFPTIKEQTYNNKRIDVVEEFAYDTYDDNTPWVNESGETANGEYKHPHFFAKLRPLGFNLFDLALQDDMVLSLTTGHCGGCNFKIKVDEKTKKNPVQIWPYDIGYFDTDGNFIRMYQAGDLVRYGQYGGCYYKIGSNVYEEVPNFGVSGGFNGFIVNNVERRYSDIDFEREDVENGLVGNTTTRSNIHIEGDVKTRGRFIDSQQDTTDNYVWVALEKDTEAYGTLMPSATINYSDSALSVYIRPSAVADVHTEQSTAAEDEENADKFVFVNIRMPQAYIRRAEEKLSKALIKYMFENNYQKYAFDIKFSRIFLAQNPDTLEHLNEASLLYLLFNNRKYKQYAFAYNYRMSKGEPLPEITVNLDDDKNLVYNKRSPYSRISIREEIMRFSGSIPDKRTQGTDGSVRMSSSLEMETLRSQVNEMSNYIRTSLLRRGDVEITDGKTIRVGNMVMSPAYIEDGLVKQDAHGNIGVGYAQVEAKSINPAIIDGENRKVRDTTNKYDVLQVKPSDWENNYSSYYSYDGTTYTALSSVQAYAPDFGDSTVYGASYIPLSEKPDDWEQGGDKYYLKEGDQYIPLSALGDVEFSEDGNFYALVYTVVDVMPDDWETSWNQYYYNISGTNAYQRIIGHSYPPFVSDTYYSKSIVDKNEIVPVEVEGTHDAINSITSSEAYKNIITAFDQVDRAIGCNGASLPPARKNPESEKPSECVSGGELWFRTLK